MPLWAKRMFEMQRRRALLWKYRALLQRYRTRFSLTSNVKVSRHFGQEECLLRVVLLSFPPMATCTYSVGIQMLLPVFWAKSWVWSAVLLSFSPIATCIYIARIEILTHVFWASTVFDGRDSVVSALMKVILLSLPLIATCIHCVGVERLIHIYIC